jgi:hypothetical protein
VGRSDVVPNERKEKTSRSAAHYAHYTHYATALRQPLHYTTTLDVITNERTFNENVQVFANRKNALRPNGWGAFHLLGFTPDRVLSPPERIYPEPSVPLCTQPIGSPTGATEALGRVGRPNRVV